MPELIDLITTNFDYDNFFSAKLTAPMTASDTDIFLDAIPTPSEGVLVIDWDVADSREVIFYNSKTASKVTCPSVANGRGFDDTVATTHLNGANVIMAPVRAYFRLAQQLATTSEQGWKPLGYTPNTVTANGNRSYDLVFNATDLTSFISPGQRLEITRTSTAPTNCFSLDGTNDYYNDTTVSGMTFTDDFSVSAWVYLTAYPSVGGMIISRWNGTSGWDFGILSTGQVRMVGYNGGAGNYSNVLSYQSIPLNKWVHIAAQLDMSTFTATTTTSYVMIDGVNVPASVARAGTNPTALIQAGNLEIGSENGGLYTFPGYIDQVAIYSAKVTQATHLAAMNQKLTGSETSLVSAYSNGSTTDLNTTNANNLTAQNGATTAVKSPFATNGSGVSLGTKDYALVMKTSFSTNTTLTVQVPEGCTIPTSGGVSAVAYSTMSAPYGFVTDKGRWVVLSHFRTQPTTTSSATYTTFNNSGCSIYVPVGAWDFGTDIPIYNGSVANIEFALSPTSVVGTAYGGISRYEEVYRCNIAAAGVAANFHAVRRYPISLNAGATYVLYSAGATTTAGVDGDNALFQFTATPSGL